MISPPYVDVHVHLRDASALADIANAGVSAVRDAGSRAGTGLVVRLRAAQAGLRLITAGRALVKAGGYGSLLGMPKGTPAEIEQEVEELAGAGVDIIKVVATGVVSLHEAETVTAGGFKLDEIRTIVSQAAKHGLSVMCHANGAEAIKAAVAAGVRSIEHGFFMTEELLEAMKARGIFWVPTIGALRRTAVGSEAPVQQRIAKIIEGQVKLLGKAHAMGIRLAVGTDCILPDHQYVNCYQEELDWFRKAGIPSDEVERTACAGGRQLLGPE